MTVTSTSSCQCSFSGRTIVAIVWIGAGASALVAEAIEIWRRFRGHRTYLTSASLNYQRLQVVSSEVQV